MTYTTIPQHLLFWDFMNNVYKIPPTNQNNKWVSFVINKNKLLFYLRIFQLYVTWPIFYMFSVGGHLRTGFMRWSGIFENSVFSCFDRVVIVSCMLLIEKVRCFWCFYRHGMTLYDKYIDDDIRWKVMKKHENSIFNLLFWVLFGCQKLSK